MTAAAFVRPHGLSVGDGFESEVEKKLSAAAG